MNEEQLKKLYDLMRVIIISQNKGINEDVFTINGIIWNMINKRHTPKELLWCNDKWKFYEGYKIDLSKKFVFPIYELGDYDKNYNDEETVEYRLIDWYDGKDIIISQKYKIHLAFPKSYTTKLENLKEIGDKTKPLSIPFGLVIVRHDDGGDDDDGIIARIDFPNLPDGLKKSNKMESRWKADGKLEFSQLAKVIKVVISDDGETIKEIIKL